MRFEATTKPLGPTSFRTEPTDVGARLRLGAWDDLFENGEATRYDVEGRVGDGPWTRRPPEYGIPVVDLPATSVPLTFRARAVAGDHATDWTESGPIVGEPTLAVTLTAARMGRGGLVLEGSFASTDLVFAEVDLRAATLLVGDLWASDVRAFSPTWRWESSRGWMVVGEDSRRRYWRVDSLALDAERGRFRVEAEGWAFGPDETPAGPVVHLSFGAFSGGAVGRWRRAPDGDGLVLDR